MKNRLNYTLAHVLFSLWELDLYFQFASTGSLNFNYNKSLHCQFTNVFCLHSQLQLTGLVHMELKCGGKNVCFRNSQIPIPQVGACVEQV